MYRPGHARARPPLRCTRNATLPSPPRPSSSGEAGATPFAKVLHETSIPFELKDSIAHRRMRQVSFSVRAPYFPLFAQRGPTFSISLQALSQVHPFSDAEWRAALPRNPSRYRRRAMSAVSRCVLIRSNFTWPCQLPAAPARSLVRFPLPSPIAISNHSIAHLMKNTLNKREGEKDGDGE